MTLRQSLDVPDFLPHVIVDLLGGQRVLGLLGIHRSGGPWPGRAVAVLRGRL
jgi:hypothetical protein